MPSAGTVATGRDDHPRSLPPSHVECRRCCDRLCHAERSEASRPYYVRPVSLQPVVLSMAKYLSLALSICRAIGVLQSPAKHPGGPGRGDFFAPLRRARNDSGRAANRYRRYVVAPV